MPSRSTGCPRSCRSVSAFAPGVRWTASVAAPGRSAWARVWRVQVRGMGERVPAGRWVGGGAGLRRRPDGSMIQLEGGQVVRDGPRQGAHDREPGTANSKHTSHINARTAHCTVTTKDQKECHMRTHRLNTSAILTRIVRSKSTSATSGASCIEVQRRRAQ